MASTLSKVINVTDFAIMESPCDLLLVNNTNWYPSLHRFQVISDYLVQFSVSTGRCLFNALVQGEKIPELVIV